MPLILGLQKGHDFYVGAEMTRVKLVEVNTPFSFTLSIKGQRFVIEDDCAQEILPNVRVSGGLRGSDVLARVIIDAPRDIKIFRGNVARLQRKTTHADVPIFKRSQETGEYDPTPGTLAGHQQNDIPVSQSNPS